MKINLFKLKKELQEIARCPVELYHKETNHIQYVKISDVLEVIKKLQFAKRGRKE